jgi:hypothetical protein
VEHLPCKRKAVSSTPSTAKKKKRKMILKNDHKIALGAGKKHKYSSILVNLTYLSLMKLLIVEVSS